MHQEPGHNLRETVDWMRLSTTFLRPQYHERLDAVWYFSVWYQLGTKASILQTQYHKQLKASGVSLVYGQYKQKRQKCSLCTNTFSHKEEKETDVNIALQVAYDAEDGCYDRAIIVSADTDLVPAIKAVKARHPEKEILVVTPPYTKDRKRQAHLTSTEDTFDYPLILSI